MLATLQGFELMFLAKKLYFRSNVEQKRLILGILASNFRVRAKELLYEAKYPFSKFQMAALGRGDVPADQRPPFYLYLDEFQNFTTDSVGTILSEARKYGLALHMAHQFIDQLDDAIREAVFGNVGTIASYRIGTKDAEFVAKEFEPVFSAYDLVNIDKYEAYIKMLIDHTPTRPFNLKVDPPFAIRRKDSINREMAATIRELSRLKYGRDRAVIETSLHRR